MKRDIKKLVSYYVRKYNTRNPFELADYLNVQVQIGDLGSRAGCYMFLKNHKCVFLNKNLHMHEMLLVMAHELGHAILHRKENCYFIQNHTLMLTSKSEIEANTFATELLISDKIVKEHPEHTVAQLSRLLGYEKHFIQLKLKNLCENLSH